MAWDDDLLDLMPTTVVISTGTTKDKYGGYTYGTGSTYEAREVNAQDHNQINSGLSDEVSTIVYAKTPAPIPFDVKVVLADGTSPPVLTIDNYPDEDGHHHTRIRLGTQQ